MEYLQSSESVSEGHPDKVADQISDALLDAYIGKDPNSRVALETMLAKNLVVIAGEVSSEANVDIKTIVRETLRDIGYTDERLGMDCFSCEIITSISEQSLNIAKAVGKTDGRIGAGDQGSMYGYATNETPELMPLPINLAHKLVKRVDDLRKNGTIPWLGPDAKSQVIVAYRDGVPYKIESVVLSAQHQPDITDKEIHYDLLEKVITPVIPAQFGSDDFFANTCLINPSGRFETGGPKGDVGLTGRKIIVDTYGGSCPHGGGAFSGKDPTKVDRSAAYMARYIAKNIVAAELADRCTVQLSYAIGRLKPLAVSIDFHGSGIESESRIRKCIEELFELDPLGIINTLKLRRPIYKKSAVYGHFGRELPDFTWEDTDRVDDILDCVFGACKDEQY